MNDEIANLTRFLDEHRDILRRKAGGLDHDDLMRTLPPSDLTLGGMVKHLAFVEDWWFGRTLTLRWILAHMIAEYARHLGHADLIRQSVDGQVGDTWISAR